MATLFYGYNCIAGVNSGRSAWWWLVWWFGHSGGGCGRGSCGQGGCGLSGGGCGARWAWWMDELVQVVVLH